MVQASDPPETGILLPGSGGYKRYVQYFAEKIVASNPGAAFSDTSYTNNNARYQELEHDSCHSCHTSCDSCNQELGVCTT